MNVKQGRNNSRLSVGQGSAWDKGSIQESRASIEKFNITKGVRKLKKNGAGASNLDIEGVIHEPT